MKHSIRNKYMAFVVTVAAVAILTVFIYAQKGSPDCPMTDKAVAMNHDDCPMMKKDKHDLMKHLDMVQQNGEKEMGFSQTATTHHFVLMKDGGAIRIDVNDDSDSVNKQKIRDHLKEIAGQFSKGAFQTPFAIHGRIPPGVPVMDELKSLISYEYQETESGAQVRVRTNDAKALAAVHEFLRFQIEDHQTGDPTVVTE